MLLLPGQFDGKFAVADTGGQSGRVARRRFFSVSGDQLGQGEKQRGLRQTVALNSLVMRLGPGILQIGKRQALLLFLGYGASCRQSWRRQTHRITDRRHPAPSLPRTTTLARQAWLQARTLGKG